MKKNVIVYFCCTIDKPHFTSTLVVTSHEHNAASVRLHCKHDKLNTKHANMEKAFLSCDIVSASEMRFQDYVT